MQDDELIGEIHRGDEGSASSLIEKYWQQVFRYLYRLSCNFHDAEELTQQTFLRVFERLDQYAIGTNFRAWMYRVATNSFLDHQRKLKRRGDSSGAEVAVASAYEAPDAIAAEKELTEAIERAIMNMPEDERIVLTLRVNEDMSYGQIAEIVDSPESTVRWRLHKTRRQLLKMLEAYL